MVIYFLLFFFFCCIYGNFLINMEWSFIFKSKVVEMYCTVFFIIVARFSFLSRPEVSFSRESRVFVLFFHVRRNFEVAQSFLWIILLCLQPVQAVVTESHKRTSFLTVKLLWALWFQLSAWYLFCVRPAHVLMPFFFFFSIGLFYFEH